MSVFAGELSNQNLCQNLAVFLHHQQVRLRERRGKFTIYHLETEQKLHSFHKEIQFCSFIKCFLPDKFIKQRPHRYILFQRPHSQSKRCDLTVLRIKEYSKDDLLVLILKRQGRDIKRGLKWYVLLCLGLVTVRSYIHYLFFNASFNIILN